MSLLQEYIKTLRSDTSLEINHQFLANQSTIHEFEIDNQHFRLSGETDFKYLTINTFCFF